MSIVLPKIIWQTGFEFSAGTKDETTKQESLMISGVALDTSVNTNKWQASEDEMPTIADGMKTIQLRVDHGSSVRDVIGGLTETLYDKDNKRILFKAEVDDPNIIAKILKKRVNQVSIGATADSVICSVCGKATRPIRTCKCEGSHEIIKGVKVRELSIVASPAYEETKFVPLGFTAGVEASIFSKDNTPVNGDILGVETTTIDDKQSIPNSQINKMEEKVKMAEEKKETATATATEVEAQPATVLVKKLDELLERVKKYDELDSKIRKVEDALGKLEKKGKPPEDEEDEEEEEETKKEDEDEDEKKKEDEDEEKKKLKKELKEANAKLEAMSKKGAKVDTSGDGFSDNAPKEGDWIKEVYTAAKKYEIIT